MTQTPQNRISSSLFLPSSLGYPLIRIFYVRCLSVIAQVEAFLISRAEMFFSSLNFKRRKNCSGYDYHQCHWRISKSQEPHVASNFGLLRNKICLGKNSSVNPYTALLFFVRSLNAGNDGRPFPFTLFSCLRKRVRKMRRLFRRSFFGYRFLPFLSRKLLVCRLL